jgi:redox-sensitive bicupin YhaK (pirin superfamily)
MCLVRLHPFRDGISAMILTSKTDGGCTMERKCPVSLPIPILEGFIDHSDSHGASGRYGNGDVQWMTAGSGLQHAEMFPLLKKEEANPAELFQVWLNLPASRKFSAPFYKMLWSEDIPIFNQSDKNGKTIEIRIIAGNIGATEALPPAPDSWAADPDNDVAIWLIKMESGAEWTLPAAKNPVSRMLYFYQGNSLIADQNSIPGYHCCEPDPGKEIVLQNGNCEGRILILQGKPIKEPVMQYGPFVMNTEEEIREAFRDFRETQFGGWPWGRTDPVHGPEMIRFARFPDGRSIVKG